MPLDWQDRLHCASSEAEVIEAARDFIVQFSPYEINQLPSACRPPRVKDGDDIAAYAFTLVRHHCDDGEGVGYVVHRLRAFFSEAAYRLSQILQEQSQGQSQGQDDSRKSA
jgi:hypothetical protein